MSCLSIPSRGGVSRADRVRVLRGSAGRGSARSSFLFPEFPCVSQPFLEWIGRDIEPCQQLHSGGQGGKCLVTIVLEVDENPARLECDFQPIRQQGVGMIAKRTANGRQGLPQAALRLFGAAISPEQAFQPAPGRYLARGQGDDSQKSPRAASQRCEVLPVRSRHTEYTNRVDGEASIVDRPTLPK